MIKKFTIPENSVIGGVGFRRDGGLDVMHTCVGGEIVLTTAGLIKNG